MKADPAQPSHGTPGTNSQFGYRLTGLPLRLAQTMWAVSLALTIGLLGSGFYAVLAYPPEQWFSGAAVHPTSLQVGQFYAAFLVPLQLLIALAALGLSGLVFWRRHDDGVAILCSLTSLTVIGVMGLGVSEVNPWGQPFRDWASMMAVSIALAAGPLTLLLFPNGRFVPGWARWPALLWVGWVVLQIFVPSLYIYNLPAPVWGILQLLILGLGTWAQVYRYRHTKNLVQRQQTRLIVYAFVQLLLLQGLYQMLILGRTDPTEARLLFTLARLIYYTSRVVLMLLIAVAVLRYRLWGIEFIVNRSLVYGLFTLGLGGVFAGVLYLVSLIVPTQATLIAVAITAGVAGVTFQPARRRLQHWVDRHLYNIQINYQSQPAPRPTPASLPPVRLADYQNLKLIGRGGMAEVYQATHPTHGSRVAIKLLYGEAVDSPEYRQRMMREGRMMTRLEHPNIVRVLDYGETTDPSARPYLVIEYLEGEDLGRRLKARGKLSLEDSLAILGQMCGALDHAHGQGIIHRDIKPSNVMLVPEGTGERAVLMDFGIAKLVGSQTMMTHTGGMVGTFDYVAPEQIQSAADVDGRADIYALGILAYQMLTGELPFKHPNPGGLLIAHLTQPPPDPRQLSPEIPSTTAHAILKALAKKPAERFSSAGEFYAALQPIQAPKE